MIMKYIVSLSGGKDSTAMLHWLLEKNYPVDGIVFMDTGWEFPAMLEHIDLVEKNIGIPITRAKPRKSFEHWLLHQKVVAKKGPMKGKVHRIGYGWPSSLRRWCTREKVGAIIKHMKRYETASMYIGIAADEAHRQVEKATIKNKDYVRAYPLIEWGKTEADCLEYCKELGYHWDGLYDIFCRVSCFCCPLQRVGELRKLRKHFPDLWAQMLEWDHLNIRGFRGEKSVYDMDKRFFVEDQQLFLPGF